MRKARLTFLGTGTSQGVPIIGCKCDVCTSPDTRDKRFRSSVFVEYEGLGILVDAGPDFRMQMLAHDLCHLDAILLTHNHKDHTGGLDDVRSLNYIDKRAAEIYCERNVLDDLIKEYPYVFAFPEPRSGICMSLTRIRFWSIRTQRTWSWSGCTMSATITRLWTEG